MGQIHFIDRLSWEDWYDLFRISTVMLDTFPFGGYTTSLEALSLGLPIVTLPHKMLAGNCTAAFLRVMGLARNLVASDRRDYVQKAVRVATDTTFRETLRTGILTRKWKLFEGNS